MTIKRHSAAGVAPKPVTNLMVRDVPAVEPEAPRAAASNAPWGNRVASDRRGVASLTPQFVALWNPAYASPTLAGSVHEVVNWTQRVTQRTALDGLWRIAADLELTEGVVDAVPGLDVVARGDRVTLEELKPMVATFQKLRGLERALVGEAMLRNDIEGRATPEALKLLKAVLLPEVTGRSWDERILLRDFAWRLYALTEEALPPEGATGAERARNLSTKEIKARAQALLSGFHDLLSHGEDPLARAWEAAE